MPPRLGVMVCRNLEAELLSAVKAGGLADVQPLCFTAQCHHQLADWSPVLRALEAVDSELPAVRLLGGSCLPADPGLPPGLPRMPCSRASDCTHHFTGSEPAGIQPGDRVLLPGWVVKWREYVQADEPAVRSFLGIDTSRLLLVDTGTVGEAGTCLADLARFAGVPAVILPTGPALFRATIANMAALWSVESQRDRLNSLLASTYRRLTDHTLVQELVAVMTETMAEDKVVERVFDLLTTLMAPRTMVFVALDEDKVEQAWSRPAALSKNERLVSHLAVFRKAYGWNATGTGFRLCIRHRNRALGVVEIGGITLTDSREHYLDLALAISRVSALAISNARLYRDLKGPSHNYLEFAEDLQDAMTIRRRAEERQAELLRRVEAANQELADFAYVVSHDLKAPLRAISSLVGWLASDYGDKFDDAGREQVELLLGRVRRMHALIDGILQYSRVGRVMEEKTEVDLSQVVPEIITMLAPPVHIRVTIETDLPTITVEPTRIGQVFQNLLSNAIKYNDKPEGAIRIGCLAENGFWRFYVADNGPGIEEKDRTRIFGIFQTGKPRDQVDSTGVGLAVVKKSVEMYGGTVGVESEVDRGSTFYFTFPQRQKRPPTKEG